LTLEQQEKIVTLLNENSLSKGKIAEEVGCALRTVYNWKRYTNKD